MFREERERARERERERERERDGERERDRENQWIMKYEEMREPREKWDGEGEEVRRIRGGRGEGVHE